MTATLLDLAADLAAGRTSARALTDACLDRIADPDGEGASTFIETHAASARAAADAMDSLRAEGLAPSIFAGIPISVKDLFDLAGEVTRAGSRVLEEAAPATVDAEAIARLKRAGFVIVGRTNMTEFAFSGLGLNPHYGTPLAPWQRDVGRIPGGSSSGGAVSVADAMAHGAIGTDTGGSCRIPAAFCGIVGYKPTVGTVPAEGILPLSRTLDSAGPLARSVACCRILYSIMAGAAPAQTIAAAKVPARSVAGLRIAVPQTLVLTQMDDMIAADFAAALSKLSAAGAIISEIPMEAFSRIGEMNARGALPALEGYAWHRRLLETRADAYDPRVSGRLANGAKASAADYIDLLEARAAFVAETSAEAAPYDLVAMPTVPIVPPTLGELDDDEAYGAINLLCLRNPTTINLMDGCAISLPMHEAGAAPAGLMLAKTRGGDEDLLALAEAVAPVVAPKA